MLIEVLFWSFVCYWVYFKIPISKKRPHKSLLEVMNEIYTHDSNSRKKNRDG